MAFSATAAPIERPASNTSPNPANVLRKRQGTYVLNCSTPNLTWNCAYNYNAFCSGGGQVICPNLDCQDECECDWDPYQCSGCPGKKKIEGEADGTTAEGEADGTTAEGEADGTTAAAEDGAAASDAASGEASSTSG
jgi:hypothetical protein